jgi:hypothetical protein
MSLIDFGRFKRIGQFAPSKFAAPK